MADWTETTDGTTYPETTEFEHSGDYEATHPKLTGEARVDGLCEVLHKHGIHVPYEIAPEEKTEVTEDAE